VKNTLCSPTLFAAALALVALSAAAAEPAPRSLSDARKAVRDGTTEGIVLIPARKKSTLPDDPKDERSVVTRVLSGIQAANPPSGQPINAAKRLDSPGLGIPLPTAGTAAASAPAR
jgi:hypothetical protein